MSPRIAGGHLITAAIESMEAEAARVANAPVWENYPYAYPIPTFLDREGVEIPPEHIFRGGAA